MAVFSKSNRPKLPGAYFNFANEQAGSIPSSPGSAVAIPFTHDWGPLDTVVRVPSFASFQSIFGDSDDTAGYRAVKQAFQGESNNGAGEVVCFRMGDGSAARAARVLQNTTPVNAITLTARYHGTRGNDLRITTQDFAPDAARNELIILVGATVVERYNYLDTNITDLSTQINARSNWVTAGSVTSGTALGAVSASALTAGNDGSASLLAGDWTGAATALEIHRFAIYCAYGLTDTGMVATAAAWVNDQNTRGKRFFGVFGGLAGETIGTAVTRSAALASPNIITVGVGTVTDSSLGSGGVPLALGTSEFAARVAGALAARGEERSLTHARFDGVDLTVGATLSELETAFDSGIVALARDSHPTAPVHIKTGLSTWKAIDAGADPSRPYLIYRQPKYVRTMHGLETDITQWADETIVGQVPVNDNTREALVGKCKDLLQSREQSGVLQRGWTAGIDQNPPPTDDDEFIALQISVSFGRSLEQVYFTVTVG